MFFVYLLGWLISKGKADGILCWRINRLSRNPKDGGDIQWMLQQGSIKSILTPSREYLPTDNVLMMSVELGMANQFVLDLSRDVKRGLTSKVAKGWKPGQAPLGYLNDKAGDKGEKKILVDEARFSLVRQMWDFVLSGNYTVPEAVEKANNELGLRTKGTKRHPSQKLALSTAYKIFTNVFYYGDFYYAGEIHEGKHKPMITIDEFNKVQEILGKKGQPRPKTKKLPLTGIIHCGECGGMITCDEKFKRIKKTNDIKSYLYYRCTRKKKNKKCTEKPINKKNLISQIEEELKNITISEEHLSWAIEILNQSQEKEETDRNLINQNLQKNYNNCVKRIDNLIQMFISPNNQDKSLLTDEEFKSQKNSLMQEKAKISQEIKNLDQRVDDWIELTEKTFKFATYAKYWFENGTIEERNNIIKCLGANWTLKQGKLALKLAKPFEIVQKNFILKIPKNTWCEPAETLINTKQKAPCEAIYTIMSG